MGDTHVGLQARLMSQALRKLTGVVKSSNTSLIFTNQLRQKIGVMFGNPETTTGGQALKFYARKIRDDLLDRGLSRISIVGGRPSEIWVEVPETALRELDLSLNDISASIAEASLDLPSGSIESGGRSRQIRRVRS